jgi:hypothetical protein
MNHPSRLLTLPLLALALSGVVQAANLFSQNLEFTAAETEVSFWGRGNYHPEAATIARTSQAMESLLTSQPAHPDYLALQANALVWLAYWAQEAEARATYAEQAVSTQYAALESRPAHRPSWEKLLEYASRSEGNEPMATLAQARINALNSAPL